MSPKVHHVVRNKSRSAGAGHNHISVCKWRYSVKTGSAQLWKPWTKSQTRPDPSKAQSGPQRVQSAPPEEHFQQFLNQDPTDFYILHAHPCTCTCHGLSPMRRRAPAILPVVRCAHRRCDQAARASQHRPCRCDRRVYGFSVGLCAWRQRPVRTPHVESLHRASFHFVVAPPGCQNHRVDIPAHTERGKEHDAPAPACSSLKDTQERV